MPIQSPYPSVDICHRPMHEILDECILAKIRKDPEAVAFISAENPSKRVTYREVYAQSLSIATLLSQRGFGHLDVASIVLPNSIEYGTFYLAVSRIGGILSGVSASFTTDEIARQFADNRCTAVLTDTDCIDRVMEAVKKCSKIKTIICASRDDEVVKYDILSWDDAIQTKAEPLPKYNFSSDDLAILPYSSGTTGVPKGVMLTHRGFATMMNGMLAYAINHFKPHLINQTWEGTYDYFILPFYHLYGFGMLAIMKGLTCVIVSKFNPLQFLSDIETYKLQILFLVPPIILFMTKLPPGINHDLSSVRIVLSSAAPIGVDLAEDFLKKFPNAWLGQAYGLTETGMATTLPELKIRKFCTDVGVPFSNVQVKLVDVETGKEVGRGQRGEVWVLSPCNMKGYLDRPDATREMIDEQGWLHTGDIAHLDENGRMFIVDRIKELIKVKGLQVAPAELEDLLLAHPQIGDAAVIGIADDLRGEVPKAYIVKKDPQLTADIIMQYISNKVAAYKRLAGGIEFVEVIPKSPSGKILRRILREAAKTANKQKL